MRDYEALIAEWYDLLEILRCDEPNLDGFKCLIFDTYHFLKAVFKRIKADCVA